MPIYDIADWYAMQEQIKVGSQAVSGMTAAEAQSALNTKPVYIKSGSNLQVYNPGAQPSARPPIQFPGTNASEAVTEFVSSGGTTNAAGAAVSGTATVNNSNLTLTKTAGGSTGVAGLLSVNLPTAFAAMAPFLGVAAGAALYSSNPALWERVSRTLLPFCYEDTELLPVIANENGDTFFPLDALDALKAELSDISEPEVDTGEFNISDYVTPIPFSFARGVTSITVVADYYGAFTGGWKTVRTTTTITFNSPVNAVLGNYGDNQTRRHFPTIFTSSDKQFSSTVSCVSPEAGGISGGNWGPYRQSDSLSSPVNIKSKVSFSKIYGGNQQAPTDNLISETIGLPHISYTNASVAGTTTSGLICWSMVYGYIDSYPDGISKWGGVEYPSNAATIGAIRGINPDGSAIVEPYYPITLPVGDPGVSVSPDTPDITVNPEPEPAINPWISPNPAPGTYPDGVPQSNPAELPGNVPNYTPNLDPEADPSQQPSPEPAPEPDPSPDEGSSGNSPTPAIPVFPALPSSAAGLLHVYNPTQGQIDSFGRWLWTTFSGDIIDTVSKLFNNPMDAVIGLHELYATPAVSGSSTIRAGYLDSGVSSNLVGSRYTTINCGSVVVPEYYENYLDYSPYTKCFVYLPFVGIVPVSADDIVGNAVNITYNVDSYNGCCIAIITVARAGYSSTVYQFEGNCGVEVPITSGYQSTLMGGLLGIAGTAISGSPHVGLAAASLGRANLGKNEVSHSGSFGSSYGAMGAKIPYIIVKRPTQKSVVNYNDEYGFPAHKRVRIGDCSGYLRAREVHVVSPTATDEEKARIEEMLKEGVFVK